MTSLLVLNRGLHIVDSIALRDVKSNGLARNSVDDNLHPTTEAKYQSEEWAPASDCVPAKIKRCWSWGIPSLDSLQGAAAG